MISLEGFYDIHIHTSPDVRPRKMDDIDTAQDAYQEKMKGIVLKSHVSSTAGRAALAEKQVPGIKVFGSLSLNDPVGGINPFAVEAALKMGAKIVWLPTISAQNHKRFHGDEGGITFLDMNKDLEIKLLAVLELVRDEDVALGTGHISKEEIKVVVEYARQLKLPKIIITHPEAPWIELSAAEQKELSGEGTFFERCFASTFEVGGGVPIEKIIRDIREVGFQSTVISTDFGADVLARPVDGYKGFLQALIDAGFDETQLAVMGKENPAYLLSCNQ